MATTQLDSASTASKSTEFWLHDGSIVLAVENTLFRVHQTILVNHSVIFGDLFGIPQPDDGAVEVERIEGCPVITMHDSAGDFEDLLRAIYHPSHFDRLSHSADLDTLLSFIGGILRLSTKYIIYELRRRCVALLVSRFPATYQDYVATSPRPYTPQTSRSPSSPDPTVQNDWTNALTVTFVPTTTTASDSSSTRYRVYPHSAPHSSQTSLSPPSTTTPQQPMPPQPTTAPTAQASSSNAHSSSSSSHHHHSRSRRSSHNNHHRDRERDRDKPSSSKAKDDAVGVGTPPKPKGSAIMRAIALASETNVPTILPYAYYLLARTSEPRRYLTSPPSSSSHSSSSSNLTTLSWQQKAVALVGRTFLHTAEVSMSHAFLVAFDCAPGCLSPSLCKSSRGPLVEWALLCTTGRGPEPLRPWERWDKLGVCPMCVKYARRRHERGREDVWEKLPEFFELGSWRTLRSAQEI